MLFRLYFIAIGCGIAYSILFAFLPWWLFCALVFLSCSRSQKFFIWLKTDVFPDLTSERVRVGYTAYYAYFTYIVLAILGYLLFYFGGFDEFELAVTHHFIKEPLNWFNSSLLQVFVSPRDFLGASNTLPYFDVVAVWTLVLGVLIVGACGFLHGLYLKEFIKFIIVNKWQKSGFDKRIWPVFVVSNFFVAMTIGGVFFSPLISKRSFDEGWLLLWVGHASGGFIFTMGWIGNLPSLMVFNWEGIEHSDE